MERVPYAESRTRGFMDSVFILHDDCSREMLRLLLFLDEETGSEFCPAPPRWSQHFSKGLFNSKDCFFRFPNETATVQSIS